MNCGGARVWRPRSFAHDATSARSALVAVIKSVDNEVAADCVCESFFVLKMDESKMDNGAGKRATRRSTTPQGDTGRRAKKTKIVVDSDENLAKLLKGAGWDVRTPTGQKTGGDVEVIATPRDLRSVQKCPLGSNWEQGAVVALLKAKGEHAAAENYTMFCRYKNGDGRVRSFSDREFRSAVQKPFQKIANYVFDNVTGDAMEQNNAVVYALFQNAELRPYFFDDVGKSTDIGRGYSPNLGAAFNRHDAMRAQQWSDVEKDLRELVLKLVAATNAEVGGEDGSDDDDGSVVVVPKEDSKMDFATSVLVVKKEEKDRKRHNFTGKIPVNRYGVMVDLIQLAQIGAQEINVQSGNGPSNDATMDWYFAHLLEIMEKTDLVHWCMPKSNEEMARNMDLKDPEKWKNWSTANFGRAVRDEQTGMPVN